MLPERGWGRLLGEPMNLLLIAASSFMIALSGALVPGPLFTITVSESVKRGFRAGPLIILGHGILEISIVGLLVFKVTPFLAEEGTRLIIGAVGGIVLIVLGIMTFRDAGRAQLDLNTVEDRPGGMHPVLSGIVGSVTNPYWVVWWATIGLGYLVSSQRFGIPGVIAFFIGHLSADLGWYSMISWAVSRGRHLMGQRGYRFLLYSCGLFLMLFGAWFISGV